MKLLLVICALVACTSAATVYKMKSHLEVTKEIISSSVDDPMDILESVEIEQLTSNDQDQDQESYLSKKRPVALCRLCHEVVGFVIHTTHNRTSKESVAKTLKDACHHVRLRHMCQSFVGNYSMNIVDMIVSNKTSSQICNALGSCTPRADDENDQVLRTLVLIKPENNEDDKKVLENINKDEDDDEIDNSNMNTGEVEPDYDYHENRVGNDDSQNDNTNQFQVLHDELNEDDGVETDEDDQIEPDFDYHENRVGNDDSQNDNTNQFQLNEDDEVYLPTIHVQNLQNNVAADEKLCKTCKVVVTSVLTKTTDKSSKLDIKEVLEGSCRHVIPMLKEKCKILLSKFESKIITEIYNKHSSKDICTVDLKNMCSIKQYLDIQDNSDEILQFDDIFTDDSDIDEDDLVIRDDDI